MKLPFSVPLNASKLDLSKASELMYDAKELHVGHPFLDKTF